MGAAMSSTADNDSVSENGEYSSDDQNHGQIGILNNPAAHANGEEFSGSEDSDEWEDESSSVSDEEAAEIQANNVFTPTAGRGCTHYSRGCRLVREKLSLIICSSKISCTVKTKTNLRKQ
jgi:hypothetical protein